ncbi:Whi5 like [Geosmithia morbida]|uniref:Whi5 like n=1 Tax=Geosmithia morbida TaxID=1094350 RepID=A0A9P4YYM5_9HYPO|nr:Whi5 like [Geosmithia morbida]KAF4125498.1 Whi5 like [Geosmithia morbida]
MVSSSSRAHLDSRGPETWSNLVGGVAATAPPPVATKSRAHHAADQQHDKNAHALFLSTATDERFSQSDPRSAEGSQASNATSVSDQVFTPALSDHDHDHDYNDTLQHSSYAMTGQYSQLRQLSAIAAAQDRMKTDAADVPTASRKRMADGEVKSPVRTHSRNTSTMSMASTTSTIGDLSHDLRTRLSYAMVKVNNGWQSHNLDQVEELASQAASPTSSASTTTRHSKRSSSVSPQLSGGSLAHAALSNGLAAARTVSNSPPASASSLAGRPTLAPPAPIRPSAGLGATAPKSNARRNSNPTYTPTLLSRSQSASNSTPGNHLHQRGPPENLLHSPHQNVREQDAIESLLFMSSPNNSANVKHSFSPTTSPDPSSSQPALTRSAARHALPGARKALPSQRPSASASASASKRVDFSVMPTMAPLPDSPMDLDTPQHTPIRDTPRRRTNQAGSSHMRGALSLPSALGISHVAHRQRMTDKDIDQMLDREDESFDSSDNEEIQIPPRQNRAIRA